jgi:hypothetical protein
MWAHATNSAAALAAALGRATHIEADVMLLPVGGGGAPVPAMAHPPATGSDLACAALLAAVAAHNAAGAAPRVAVLKLDFKDPAAVAPVLALLAGGAPPGAEVWLNADVLPGPCGAPPAFAARAFVDACRAAGPRAAVLSLGWTVGSPRAPWGLGYAPAAVDAMLALCREAAGGARVTFAMHAAHALAAPAEVRRLLAADAGYSVTLWGAADAAMDAALARHAAAAPGRVFVDTHAPVGARQAWGLWLARLLGVLRLDEPLH